MCGWSESRTHRLNSHSFLTKSLPSHRTLASSLPHLAVHPHFHPFCGTSQSHSNMRNQSRDNNHPIQPLSPKKQPRAMTQATNARKDNSRFAKEATAMYKRQTVQEELVLRMRIEQRAMLKVEKLHEAVSLSRQTRRLQRQKSAGNAGEIVKALQGKEEMKRSLSLKENHLGPRG